MANAICTLWLQKLRRSFRLADAGIASSAAHAEREFPSWNDQAVDYVRRYALLHSSFLAEHVRVFAELDGFPAPPEKRAWGNVMRRAAKEGIVANGGFRAAVSSNGGPKSLWLAVRPGA